MRYMRTQSMRTHYSFYWTSISENCPQIIQNIFWEINGKFMEINVKNSEHAHSSE